MSKVTSADLVSVIETLSVAFTSNSEGPSIDVQLNLGKASVNLSYNDEGLVRLLHLRDAVNYALLETADMYSQPREFDDLVERLQQLRMFEIDTTMNGPFVPPQMTGDQNALLAHAKTLTWTWRSSDIEGELVNELLCTISLGFVNQTAIITPTAYRTGNMARVLVEALKLLAPRVDILEGQVLPKVSGTGLRVSTAEVLNNALAIGYDFSAHGDVTIVTCNIDFPLWGQTRSVSAPAGVIDRHLYMRKALDLCLDALVFDFAEGGHEVQRSLKAIRVLREKRQGAPVVVNEPTSANIGASMPKIIDVTIDPADPDPEGTLAFVRAENPGSEVRVKGAVDGVPGSVRVGDATNGQLSDEEQLTHVKPNFVPLGFDVVGD